MHPNAFANPVGLPIAFADTAATDAIKANSMHLVEIGHGAVAFGEITDATDRGNIAIH